MWRLCALWLIYAIWEVTPQVTERMGCFQDREPFILSGVIYRRYSDMTVDWCLNECLIQRDDVFAGLEAGYACFCGNNMNHTKYGPQRHDSECRKFRCRGNSSQTCGGTSRLDIYRDYNECSLHNGGCGMACVNTPLSYYCDCHNAPDTEECSCRDGFDPVDGGKMLQCTDRNECDVDNGGCNQKCVNSLGAYHCACHMGYRLVGGEKQNCTDVNECTDDPDLCNMDNFECINTPGLYQCECKPGYFNDQGSCSDIDECSLGDDKCNQNCSNTDGDYICSCMAGYELAGDELYNCTDEDECADVNTCDQVCTNLPGGYKCSCHGGYRPDDEQGASCADIDECTEGSHQCHQTCVNTPGLYHCVCENGYHLEQDLYTCSDVYDSDLLQQIAGLERRTTGFIVGLAVMSLAFATCLVFQLCVCIRLNRDNKTNKCTSTPLQDSPSVAPRYEDVTNYNPERSAHYEGLQEFHLEESIYQTVTSSVQTS